MENARYGPSQWVGMRERMVGVGEWLCGLSQWVNEGG